MKNSNKLLACTLGLMLGVGVLVGCGSTVEYTVTFKHGNETDKEVLVKAGDLCPEYVPAAKAEHTFMGWYTSRSVRDDSTKFDFATPINSDLTLYSWYKADFKPSTDVFYLVGSFKGVDYGTNEEGAVGEFGPGSYWDGGPGCVVQDNRKMVLNEAEFANEKNVYEFTIDLINFGEKFRIIKSTDGLVSDGWVDTYGYDLVSKVIGVDGTELVKEEALVEQDSKNIGVNFSGKLKVTYTMESDFSANGEIVLTILEEFEIVYPESVSFMGSFAASNWENDIDLVTADEGATWTGSQDFVVGDTWKLRMNYGWATSWGFDNLRNYPAEALDNEPNADGNGFSGNIRVLQAGTFTVSFDYLASKIDVTFVPGEVEEPEPVIETLTITAADLGLGAYADGDKTVGEYGIHFNQAGDYGNGIQLRNKNNNPSYIANTTAFEKGIVKLDLNWSTTKVNEYNNSEMIKVEFANTADFADAEVVYVDTVANGTTYEAVPSVTTYQYVRITQNLSFSSYWASIVISYNA